MKLVKKIVKILLGLFILFILLGIAFSCGDTENHDNDANVTYDDITYQMSNVNCTDNSGDDVPIIVTTIGYKDGFYSGSIDYEYSLENLTDVDYKEAKFAVMAWDKEGFPVKINEVDYTSIFTTENISANGVKDCVNNILNVVDIGYMAFYLAECTDFEGNTWVNPIMDSISEVEGNMLKNTDISYFTFE